MFFIKFSLFLIAENFYHKQVLSFVKSVVVRRWIHSGDFFLLTRRCAASRRWSQPRIPGTSPTGGWFLLSDITYCVRVKGTLDSTKHYLQVSQI